MSYQFDNPPSAANWARTTRNLQHIDDLVDEKTPRDVDLPEGSRSRPNIAKQMAAFQQDIAYAGRLAQINARSALTRGVLTFWPSVEAARSQGVTAIYLENAGTGGQDGVYTLLTVGGNPVVPAALRVSIENGSVEAVLIDYPGHGYQSAPTLDFSLVPDLVDVDAEASLGTNVPNAAYFTVANDDSFTIYVNRTDGASAVSSYASVEKVQRAVDAITASPSKDIHQSVDRSGVALARVTQRGGIAIPGHSTGLQNGFMSQAAARLAEMQWRGGYSEPELNYARDRAWYGAQVPIKEQFWIAKPYIDGTKRQRQPKTGLVRPGRIYVSWGNLDPDQPNTDTVPARGVYKLIDYDTDTFEVLGISEFRNIFDFGDASRAENGSSGAPFVRHPKTGVPVVLGSRGGPAVNRTPREYDTDRNFFWAEILETGELGPIHEIYGIINSSYGSAGNIVQLQHGPNAGRILLCTYTADEIGDQSAVMYTDDLENWFFGTPFDANGTNEWHFAEAVDGSMLGIFRNTVSLYDMQSVSTDGGITWAKPQANSKPEWVSFENKKVALGLGHQLGSGTDKIAWQSSLPLDEQRGSKFGRIGLGLRLSYDNLDTVAHQYRYTYSQFGGGYSELIQIAPDVFFATWETGFNTPSAGIVGQIFNLAEVLQNGRSIQVA